MRLTDIQNPLFFTPTPPHTQHYLDIYNWDASGTIYSGTRDARIPPQLHLMPSVRRVRFKGIRPVMLIPDELADRAAISSKALSLRPSSHPFIHLVSVLAPETAWLFEVSLHIYTLRLYVLIL